MLTLPKYISLTVCRRRKQFSVTVRPNFFSQQQAIKEKQFHLHLHLGDIPTMQLHSISLFAITTQALTLTFFTFLKI